MVATLPLNSHMIWPKVSKIINCPLAASWGRPYSILKVRQQSSYLHCEQNLKVLLNEVIHCCSLAECEISI